MLKSIEGKKILITGNTGFKGSWLTQVLLQKECEIFGFSDQIPTDPSLFGILSLEEKINQRWGDIREPNNLRNFILKIKPDFVFHLAAQPLVRKSFENPIETFNTNAIGTLNLLEAIREYDENCVVVVITSDKVYKNQEWAWGYRENDLLGGNDPYSGSKAAAEIIISSHLSSFWGNSPQRMAIARAGNVIGGGDWAEDRIVPDAIKAWSKHQTLQLRNPKATRPWQHVLEPIFGYLKIADFLAKSKTLHGEAFNLGPPMDQDASVSDLIEEMKKHWPSGQWEDIGSKDDHFESQLLKLNCDKALQQLGWFPLLDFEESVRMTTQWYRRYHDDSSSIRNFTQEQIHYYSSLHE
jgi:CDP-glucose 4,6-dehydratase